MWEMWVNELLPKALKLAKSPINCPIWSHCLCHTILLSAAEGRADLVIELLLLLLGKPEITFGT